MWWEELVGLVCWLHLFVGTLSKKPFSVPWSFVFEFELWGS